MSVIVKGMKMPKKCDECHFYRYWDEMASSCRAFNKTKWIDDCDMKKERHPDCQLIELPPHGDLIDRDALMKKLNNCMFPSDMVTTRAVSMAMNWLKESPTIIESEG